MALSKKPFPSLPKHMELSSKDYLYRDDGLVEITVRLKGLKQYKGKSHVSYAATSERGTVLFKGNESKNISHDDDCVVLKFLCCPREVGIDRMTLRLSPSGANKRAYKDFSNNAPVYVWLRFEKNSSVDEDEEDDDDEEADEDEEIKEEEEADDDASVKEPALKANSVNKTVSFEGTIKKATKKEATNPQLEEKSETTRKEDERADQEDRGDREEMSDEDGSECSE